MATILSALLLVLTSLPQPSNITITLDSRSPGIIVPGSVATITGQEWATTSTFGGIEGSDALAGYTVRIGLMPCKVRFVSPSGVTFIVPDNIEPGMRVLEVSGPAGAFSTNVEVKQYHPILVEQGGYVIATSAARMYPTSYNEGQAIPVSPMTFNYVSFQMAGMPTSEMTPVTVILDGPHHYEIPGQVWAFIGFPGITNVMFFAPSCANGEYLAKVIVVGQESLGVPVRFVSDCLVRSEGARVRKR